MDGDGSQQLHLDLGVGSHGEAVCDGGRESEALDERRGNFAAEFRDLTERLGHEDAKVLDADEVDAIQELLLRIQAYYGQVGWLQGHRPLPD